MKLKEFTVLKDDERALLKWLEGRSLNEVLNWFDAVELTRLVGKAHPAIRIITEKTRRDMMFLDRIGYKYDLAS